MTIRNLGRLLEPTSIAVVGASDRPGSVGATVWRNLRAGPFSGPVYAVNQRHTSLEAPRKFMSAARAAARNKPVVVVKAGRAGNGLRAAASHTGALAGSDIVIDAVIRRAGMLRVDTLQDLFMAAETLARFSSNCDDTLTLMTKGGGAGVLAADAAALAGVPLHERGVAGDLVACEPCRHHWRRAGGPLHPDAAMRPRDRRSPRRPCRPGRTAGQARTPGRVLAKELISRTKVSKLLAGYRDRPPAKIDAICDALIALSQMLADLPELAELDNNPLWADHEGVLALDARVRVSRDPGAGAARFAITPYPRELVRTAS